MIIRTTNRIYIVEEGRPITPRQLMVAGEVGNPERRGPLEGLQSQCKHVHAVVYKGGFCLQCKRRGFVLGK